MEDDVRNQLKTKSTIMKQYPAAVLNGYLPYQHLTISTILYQGGAPKPWAALQTMQVWQTVSSSRQRARNAERITKKPLGHAVGDRWWCG